MGKTNQIELDEANEIIIREALRRLGPKARLDTVRLQEQIEKVAQEQAETIYAQLSEAARDQAYTTMRTFDTLEKAAENPGGGAGALLAAGVGLGVGIGAGAPLGKQLGESLNVSAENGQDAVTRLQTLKRMLDEKLISQEEGDSGLGLILNIGSLIIQDHCCPNWLRTQLGDHENTA
jgi:hypothetical protein